MFLLYDDFDDNTLNSRNALIGILGKISQINGAITLKRNWQTNNVSVSSGVVTLNPNSSMITNPLHSAAATKNIEWEFKARCTYSGIDHALRVSLFTDSNLSNRWTHFAPNWQSAGILNYLWKIVNGTRYFIITATHTGNTNWHIIKGRRTTSGGWEIFYDGVSDGTAIDTWMPSANTYFAIHNDPGTYVKAVELDYIWVKII